MKTINAETLRTTIAASIKERRQGKRFSQRQLAELLNTKQQRIAELEAGKAKDIDLYLSCLIALGGRITFDWQ